MASWEAGNPYSSYGLDSSGLLDSAKRFSWLHLLCEAMAVTAGWNPGARSFATWKQTFILEQINTRDDTPIWGLAFDPLVIAVIYSSVTHPMFGNSSSIARGRY